MPNLLQLKERRANVWSQMTSVLDTAEAENRDLTGEERSTYDAAEADLDGLTKDIERIERHESRSGFDVPSQHTETPEHRETKDPEAEYRAAFGRYLKTADEAEVRALSVGTNSAGGYTVPPGFRDQIVQRMKAYGNVMNVAQVITTDSGANLQWPTVDDTSNVGALLAENTQMSEQDITVGTAALDAYLYYSKLTRLSLQLVQDSAFDIEQFVIDAHAERIGRIVNQHLTTGTGSSQPDGIVTSATSGVTAAGTSAVTSDEIIDLTFSLDPAYRTSPRARFMTSDTGLKAVRKLKDGQGNYLWQPSYQTGVPDQLLGYQVEINQDMAVPATGVKSWLFGDFYAGYVVRLVRGIQVLTFNERYLDYLQVAHASYMRVDGTLQNANAYRALTQA